MQLYDLLFWCNLSKNNINYWTTKLAMITNNLQPIILLLLIKFISKRKLKPIVLIIVGLYTIAAAVYIIKSWNEITYTLVNEKTSPSLYWEWVNLDGNMFVYGLHLLSLAVLFWDGFDWPINWILVAVTLISFIFTNQYYKGITAGGRFWCYFAAYIPLLLIFMFIK